MARREAGLEKTADNQLNALVEKLKSINWPWKREEPGAFSTWKPYALGAGAALGVVAILLVAACTYATNRIFGGKSGSAFRV